MWEPRHPPPRVVCQLLLCFSLLCFSSWLLFTILRLDFPLRFYPPLLSCKPKFTIRRKSCPVFTHPRSGGGEKHSVNFLLKVRSCQYQRTEFTCFGRTSTRKLPFISKDPRVFASIKIKATSTCYFNFSVHQNDLGQISTRKSQFVNENPKALKTKPLEIVL